MIDIDQRAIHCDPPHVSRSPGVWLLRGIALLCGALCVIFVALAYRTHDQLASARSDQASYSGAYFAGRTSTTSCSALPIVCDDIGKYLHDQDAINSLGHQQSTRTIIATVFGILALLTLGLSMVAIRRRLCPHCRKGTSTRAVICPHCRTAIPEPIS